MSGETGSTPGVDSSPSMAAFFPLRAVASPLCDARSLLRDSPRPAQPRTTSANLSSPGTVAGSMLTSAPVMGWRPSSLAVRANSIEP